MEDGENLPNRWPKNSIVLASLKLQKKCIELSQELIEDYHNQRKGCKNTQRSLRV